MLVLAACASPSSSDDGAPRATVAATTTSISAETVPTTAVPAPPTSVALPEFVGLVSMIDDALARRMTASWRPGCPVPLADLRYLQLRHWGFDAAVQDGELVVHRSHADAVLRVFAELFAARFPIERMRLVDDYAGDDQASMRANNTSAFNCREVQSRPGVLSEHALGTAIDINPLVNPWVRGTTVDPPEGAAYADRSRPIVGGVFGGDVVERAFAKIGWGWGGNWPDSKDWQHFSASGR